MRAEIEDFRRKWRAQYAPSVAVVAQNGKSIRIVPPGLMIIVK